MSKVRAVIEIDAELLKAARMRAERLGMDLNGVIEDAVSRSLGLDCFERVSRGSELSESEAMDLALEAQRETRSS